LFDHLVGKRQQPRWNLEPRAFGLEVDDKLEIGACSPEDSPGANPTLLPGSQ
jgi:hypothetical protein